MKHILLLIAVAFAAHAFELDFTKNVYKTAWWSANKQLDRCSLTVQKDTQGYRSSIDLITNQELIAIQVLWYRDGNFSTTVNDIYNEVYGYNIPNTHIGLQERILLEKSCAKNPDHFTLIQELLALQKNKVLLMRKYGLQTDLESRLENYVKAEAGK